MLAAFGRPAQVATTLLIFIITFLTPVAYLVRVFFFSFLKRCVALVAFFLGGGAL